MPRTLSLLVIVLATTLVFSSAAFAQTGIMLSPLKQLKSGILAQDIKCKTGFLLVIKSSNNQPSCIRPSGEQRLLEHGWIIPKFETMQINHNATTNMTHQKVIQMVNDTSNVTTTKDIGNNTIAESMIYTLYKDWQSGNPDPDVAVSGQMPLPALQVTPTISSTNPNSIKILFIGMSPNPLKTGDTPKFTLTYQNISDKPVYVQAGCNATPLGIVISPSDSVVASFPTERLTKCAIGPVLINPNQIETDPSSACISCDQLDLATIPSNLDFGGGFYQITKDGTLHVTMKLVLRHELTGKYDQMETVQFDVNATQ